MLYSTLLAVVSLPFALAHSAKSESFFDSSSGITFQRVHNGAEGRTVSVALPPQGVRASDAIIQMTGPISDGFAGLSPAATPNNAVIFVACCWCCTNQDVVGPNLLVSSSIQPMFGARKLVGSTASSKRASVEPVISEFIPSEITDTTYKVTFRCQNCTFTESKTSDLTTMSIVSSTRRPNTISDPTMTITPSDNVLSVAFDLSEARFADYWKVVPRI